MNCANHPDRERAGFCQNCGKPLCAECMRTVGTAVFCEPCLAARLAAVDTGASAAGTPYGYVNVPGYGVPLGAAVPPVPGTPNPVLAGALGIIPGVGAMYNGQYAKGVVHLVMFAILVSLANNNNAFGLLVAGWMFYQVFEAYHTARARRDGTPLPNPFGLNDIGEKLGFGKAWTAPVAPGPMPQPSAQGTQFTQDAHGNVFYAGGDGTVFTQSAAGAQAFVPPPAPAAGAWGANPESYAYTAPPIPPIPPTPPFGAPFPPADPASFGNRNTFPVGALVMIVLGLLFFFGSSGWFRGFPVQRLIPFLLIATGVWIFFKKMTSEGHSLENDGTAAYRVRLFRAARGSVWVTLVGVLFLLDTFYILSWGHSWPLFIIVAGLMTFFERAAYRTDAALPYYPTAQVPAAGPASAASTPATVTSYKEEER